MGNARRSNGDLWHYIHTSVLGIHGCDFGVFGGGICLILGFFLRPACILLTITMLVAASGHLSRGEGLGGAAHAIKAGIVFLSLILIGPGKYSLDEKLNPYRGDDT